MLGPILALAAACVAIGLFPTIVLLPAMRVAGFLVPGGAPSPDPLVIRSAAAISVLAAGLLGLTILVLLVRHRLRGARHPGWQDTWACGALPNPRAQYTASSYAAPLLVAFGAVAGLHETRTPTSYTAHPADPVLDGVVRPIWGTLDGAGRRIRTVQSGRLRWYLLAVVFTLIGLLLNLALRGPVP